MVKLLYICMIHNIAHYNILVAYMVWTRGMEIFECTRYYFFEFIVEGATWIRRSGWM